MKIWYSSIIDPSNNYVNIALLVPKGSRYNVYAEVQGQIPKGKKKKTTWISHFRYLSETLTKKLIPTTEDVGSTWWELDVPENIVSGLIKERVT
ncbi:MAG: hypothetical protein J6I84_03685 [Bacilli bacterium]|nr:hypothetical protein [Bacilli bacterium]